MHRIYIHDDAMGGAKRVLFVCVHCAHIVKFPRGHVNRHSIPHNNVGEIPTRQTHEKRHNTAANVRTNEQCVFMCVCAFTRHAQRVPLMRTPPSITKPHTHTHVYVSNHPYECIDFVFTFAPHEHTNIPPPHFRPFSFQFTVGGFFLPGAQESYIAFYDQRRVRVPH